MPLRRRLRSHPAASVVLRAAGALAAAAALTAAGASPAPAGTTFLPPKLAKLTNARYNHDCFWAAPKGMDYANLPGAQEIQTPNLYPDVGSTYFVAQYVLPAGASLTFRDRYPYERYMSWTMFAPVGGGQIGPGDHLRDVQIAPDRGSVNPFLPGHRRDARPRAYTMHIASGPVPRVRARNTIYTRSTDPATRLGMSIRNYIPDRGRDGTGGVGLPKLTLNLRGGRKVRGAAACRALQPIKKKSTSTFPAAQWKSLVAASPDPVNAPAANPPKWERFWNALYTVAGAFISDPGLRQRTYPPADKGGFQSNPDTRYLLTQVSLRFGPVITVSGKMPTFPATLPAARTWPRRPSQVRYWSLCSGSSPVSGFGYDCVFDQQVPLRGDRRYTLVVSRPADRPRNATAACGYRWLSFGRGEDYPDPAARDYIDALYMRFMASDPRWAQAPQRVKAPGTEARVMGPYFPRSAHTTRAAFERRGCRKASSR